MKSRFLKLLFPIVIYSILSGSVAARDLSYFNSKTDSDTISTLKSFSTDPLLVNWPTFNGIQQTGKITASFNCFGTIGGHYSNFPISFEWPGISNSTSFVTPPDTSVEYLYGGTIWVGGIVNGDTLVSVGFDGWQSNQEFSPPNYGNSGSRGTVQKFDFVTDFSMRAMFTDTVASRGLYSTFDPFGHQSLNLKIAVRSHSWHSFPQNNLILYDIVITNIGSELIHEGAVGLLFDCDVGNRVDPYVDDLAGSFRNHGIGYIIDNNGDFGGPWPPATRAFAFKFLNNSFDSKDTSFNWWIGNVNGIADFSPRQRGTAEEPYRDFGTGGLGTPEGDANKYYMLKFREWDYDQIYTYSIGDDDSIWLPPSTAISYDYSIGWDTRFLMSLSTFELPPDSSIRLLCATFTGDFVHTILNSSDYLPEDPATYMSLLYFDDVIANGERAQTLADSVLNPLLPPIGLELVREPNEEFELQWDPWVFGDVNGYYIYVSEANLDELPQPGVIPPWWMPDTNSVPTSVDRTYRLEIDSLDPDKLYLAAIAHNVNGTRGGFSAPVSFKFDRLDDPPLLPSRHAYANPGGPLQLKWLPPAEKNTIDHYNIYKFDNRMEAAGAFHPFYDESYYSQFITPVDTFFIGDKIYYYYAMEPYAEIDGNDTVFFDYQAEEGEAYLIAASDKFGFESEFTEPIEANIVDEKNKDILLITNSVVTLPINFTNIDSVYAYYERILAGYDYDIYVHRDSTHQSVCPGNSVKCMDWHDFMKYKMVIVDDRLSEGLFSDKYQDSTDGFVRYLGYGGKLVHFGRLRAFGLTGLYETFLNYAEIDHEFVNEFLGIDSVHFSSERYYSVNANPPQIDTLFGFIGQHSLDSLIPDIEVDTLRDPFTSRLRTHWTPKTPPGVATFKINENSVPVSLFQSVYPGQSLQQNHVVGVRRDFPLLNTSAYTFGFHLWYMDSVEARNLISSIFADSPSALAAQSNIEPQTYRAVEAYSIEPRLAEIYLGSLSSNHTVNEIDLSSIVINYAITPDSVEIIPFVDGYIGQVLKIKVPVHNLLISYLPVWDTLNGNYQVRAQLNDGLAIVADGSITIFGHRRGDINSDDAVNILDLTLLVDYLFRGKDLPEPWQAADLDASGAVNIVDLTKLVDFIFRGQDL